jgi:SM-20-related protein
MTTLDADARFNLYLVRGFFNAQMCDEIIAELSRAPEDPATVYGRGETGCVDERVRKAARLMPSSETIERVRRRLFETREEVGAHFGINLKGCEEPQFLRYRVGDFFVAHQDGNTGLLRSEREQSRKTSVVILLNRQSEIPEAGSYEGGSLVFSEWRPDRNTGQYSLTGEAGTLVAFPAETTHQVTPVMRGERYSIVSWYG